MESRYHAVTHQNRSTSVKSTAAVVAAGLVLFLFAALYFGVFVKLLHDWYTLPDFSHGFLVLAFCVFLTMKQVRLLATVPSAGSWWGLAPLLIGLILLLLGVLGAELYLARLSFLFVTFGVLWMLSGLPLLKRFSMPIGMLLLAIPIPQVIFYQLTAPLQRVAATCAAATLSLLRIPVLQQGNIIHLASISLEVAEACSGIRSLMSLITLSVVFGYFAERGIVRRTLLAACSIPIAVIANALRIVGTGLLVQFRGPQMAMGFFHEFSGLLVFLVSVSMLLCVHVLLQRLQVPE